MDNEEIVLLLREIRDLQKVHAENYKDAIKNQQAAIELQSKASRLQKRALLVLLIVVLAGIAIAVLPSFTGR
jgi:hypothetical protein